MLIFKKESPTSSGRSLGGLAIEQLLFDLGHRLKISNFYFQKIRRKISVANLSRLDKRLADLPVASSIAGRDQVGNAARLEERRQIRAGVVVLHELKANI